MTHCRALATSATRRAGCALLLVGFLLIWVPAGAAHAHAGLVSSTPEDRSTLDGVPPRVVLAFTEPIEEPAYVVLRGPGGAEVTTGPVQVDGGMVSRAVEAGRRDRPGEYRMAYRVVSADGHPATGEVTFEVAGTGTAPTPVPDAPAPSWWSDHAGKAALTGTLVATAAALLLASRSRSARR